MTVSIRKLIGLAVICGITILVLLQIFGVSAPSPVNNLEVAEPVIQVTATTSPLVEVVTATATAPPIVNPTLLPLDNLASAQADCQNTDWFDSAVNPEGGTVDVTLVGQEPCAATWRSAGTSYQFVNCPLGWVCTFSTIAGTQVFQGTGQVIVVNGATWRPLAEYCPVLEGERQFAASQTPTFSVSPAPGSPQCLPSG